MAVFSLIDMLDFQRAAMRDQRAGVKNTLERPALREIHLARRHSTERIHLSRNNAGQSGFALWSSSSCVGQPGQNIIDLEPTTGYRHTKRGATSVPSVADIVRCG